MVEEAEYNPFSITNEPTLQNFPPLPGDLRDTFRAEILNIYEESGQQRSTEIQIFVSYVYSLIQSYHEMQVMCQRIPWMPLLSNVIRL